MENFGFRPDSDDNLVLQDIDGHYLDGVDADECSLESGPNKLFTIGNVYRAKRIMQHLRKSYYFFNQMLLKKYKYHILFLFLWSTL